MAPSISEASSIWPSHEDRRRRLRQQVAALQDKVKVQDQLVGTFQRALHPDSSLTARLAAIAPCLAAQEASASAGSLVRSCHSLARCPSLNLVLARRLLRSGSSLVAVALCFFSWRSSTYIGGLGLSTPQYSDEEVSSADLLTGETSANSSPVPHPDNGCIVCTGCSASRSYREAFSPF